MVKGSLPSLSELDVWTGTAFADTSGALRRKRAEIHWGSRRRRIGPHKEAGYTSAIANSEPEQIRTLQSGGVIYIHTRPIRCDRTDLKAAIRQVNRQHADRRRHNCAPRSVPIKPS
ncbi:hypothetical protein Pden_0159 [Paracoccus denitrificans PD1222]|jgi:hypothetical protein|uniref:Uncharacterized protein n=1 Tax=Paracoccus denitrificans (strain Pd 1222) TaxID=318586 RepID=A1AYD2_PARDP|nr:hypothetical protein Pden_0159 [Paracoccus denitrificans PD1222]